MSLILSCVVCLLVSLGRVIVLPSEALRLSVAGAEAADVAVVSGGGCSAMLSLYIYTLPAPRKRKHTSMGLK